MKTKIANIYARRQKAHEELLACDIEINEILKKYEKIINTKERL